MHSLDAVEKPPTALLAEDDPSLRPYISIVLQQQGFIVLAACNGDEALTIFRAYTGAIDLVVTDVHMGKGPTGVQVARQILQQQNDMAVLVISGTPEGEKLATDSKLPFLAKPFSLETFTARVQEVMAAARPPDRGRTADT